MEYALGTLFRGRVGISFLSAFSQQLFQYLRLNQLWLYLTLHHFYWYMHWHPCCCLGECALSCASHFLLLAQYRSQLLSFKSPIIDVSKCKSFECSYSHEINEDLHRSLTALSGICTPGQNLPEVPNFRDSILRNLLLHISVLKGSNICEGQFRD